MPRHDQVHAPEPAGSSATAYDYIVVGGGTAGSVIAARLTEDPDVRVLVVEAGAMDALPEMAVPVAWPMLMGTSANWGDATVHQAFVGGPIPAPRGKALGGSSSINGMTYVRGHRRSYDAWVEQGATGWGFDDLLPYFRRSESAPSRDATVRGVDGPMLVGPTPEPSPAVTAGLDAAREIGYPAAGDISGGLEAGFGVADVTVVDGERQSAADAYLRPVLGRPNLDVVTEAVVRRLVIRDGVCVGVEYLDGTRSVTVQARREVVLTAGAIGSAQLLLLSGVGPAGHLTELGIDVALDLPGVGANLHDHPMSTVLYEAAEPLVTDPGNVWGQGVGLLETEAATDGPDLQILLISQPYRAQTLQGTDNGYAIGFSAMVPYSRGTVRLASADPHVGPLIDPNYLSDPRDVEVMMEGLAVARGIGGADALAPWRGAEIQPGRELIGDDEIHEYLRDSLLVYFHYAGTCRVGTDDLAVVDPELRVRGISRLRVADASIMPTPVSANTVATVYAIAERAAELIAR
jgi:choline dehydrogenase